MVGSVLGVKVLRKDSWSLRQGGVAVHEAAVGLVGHLGVRHIDMPCTPEKVWRAIEAASN